MKRFFGAVAIVACASCGKLLGNDEDPSPPPPEAPVAENDGGDGAPAEAAASDAAGQSDGAVACKAPRAACSVSTECCAGTVCRGTCCIEMYQPATAALECCDNKKTLMPCDPPLTGMCCADFV